MASPGARAPFAPPPRYATEEKKKRRRGRRVIRNCCRIETIFSDNLGTKLE